MADETIQRHYGGRPLIQRIEDTLRAAGIDPLRPSRRDLWPFENLHASGIEATRRHAQQAGIQAGMYVLDVGCGLGGASRYLAAECSCRVAAIDLTPDFVEVARVLTARCGLANSIEFRQADALALPFRENTFDHVWCHSVTMNIEDKDKFALEVARVLKPSARFSCIEIAQGLGGPPLFPLPWANDESSSFLVSPTEMRSVLEKAGLRLLEQIDLTPSRVGEAERANPIMAREDFPLRAENVRTCFADGRLIAQFILAEKTP